MTEIFEGMRALDGKLNHLELKSAPANLKSQELISHSKKAFSVVAALVRMPFF